MFASTMSEVRFRSPVVLRSNSVVRMTQNEKRLGEAGCECELSGYRMFGVDAGVNSLGVMALQ